MTHWTTQYVEMEATGQLASNMKVRILVEYGEVLPVDLRDKYSAVPKVETFEFTFKEKDIKKVEGYARRRVLRELLEREQICEFIKMLDLELC